MKKISLIIFTSLIVSFVGIIPAGYAQIVDLAELNACIEDCKTSRGEGSELECTEECRTQLSRESYIPPTPKPSLLPGPNFARQDAATVGEVTDYVTVRLMPKLAARFVTLVAVVSMLGIVYAGILYFSAFGDPEKANKAKNAAIFAVIGLVLALLSFTIVQIIVSLPI